MTHNPRLYRVRKPGEEEQGVLFDDDILAPEPDPVPEETAAATPGPQKPRKLRPRDLRRARRKAKRLGLNPVDDHDAVRMLAEKGINLEDRDSFLDIVPNDQGSQAEGIVQLPAETVPSEVDHPREAPAFLSESERLIEIGKIQKQLIRRRRRRLAFLFLRLAFFVMLPTFLVGNYYYNDASKMFETKSEFVIQKSENAGATGLGGMLAGTGFAAAQDSITVQGFLTSREAMRRLDGEHGFVAHFQDPGIDGIQRLAEDATEEDAFKLYQRRVTVGFDPSEGVIRMDVVAASPEASQRFSEALIAYAEERVDDLSARVRNDQMQGAIASFENAEAESKAAQDRVLELQQMRGVLSAEAEISSQMSIINSLEMEREAKLLDLAEMRANARPNSTRITIMEAEIARLEDRITTLRSSLTESTDTTASLARVTGELKVAEADLANRQLMLQTALQQVETARIEANRQVRYLSLGVTPVAPDVATYPRKFENTVLAFVIFTSIYILISLTVSILREQVSV